MKKIFTSTFLALFLAASFPNDTQAFGRNARFAVNLGALTLGICAAIHFENPLRKWANKLVVRGSKRVKLGPLRARFNYKIDPLSMINWKRIRRFFRY